MFHSTAHTTRRRNDKPDCQPTTEQPSASASWVQTAESGVGCHWD